VCPCSIWPFRSVTCTARGTGVGDAVGVDVGVAVAVTDGVAVAVAVWVGVIVGVTLGAIVAVGVGGTGVAAQPASPATRMTRHNVARTSRRGLLTGWIASRRVSNEGFVIVKGLCV